MRFLLHVNIPVVKGNKVARTAKMWETIKVILDDLNPEAAYFTAARGQRSAYLIVDMQDESQIPAIAEPWFLAFNASVEITPVMLPEDLMHAETAIQQAVVRYRRPLSGKEKAGKKQKD